MSQPNVPWYFAAVVVVLGAMTSAALAFSDPAVLFLTPAVKFILFIANVGLTTLAVVLNIKKPT